LEKITSQEIREGLIPCKKIMEVIKMEEVKDKINIHYLKIIIDYIEYPIKEYNFSDIIEDFGNKELLKQLVLRMLNINRKNKHYERKLLKYKYNKITRIGKIFKINQTKDKRKGRWYKSILLIQDMINKGNKEKAIKYAKSQINYSKKYHKRTYYNYKKELKDLGIIV